MSPEAISKGSVDAPPASQNIDRRPPTLGIIYIGNKERVGATSRNVGNLRGRTSRVESLNGDLSWLIYERLLRVEEGSTLSMNIVTESKDTALIIKSNGVVIAGSNLGDFVALQANNFMENINRLILRTGIPVQTTDTELALDRIIERDSGGEDAAGRGKKNKVIRTRSNVLHTACNELVSAIEN